MILLFVAGVFVVAITATLILSYKDLKQKQK